MKKIKYVLGIIILIIISCIMVVYADYLYESKDVEYNNSNSTLTSTDVQGAIDELYEKVSNIPIDGCPDGYLKQGSDDIYTCINIDNKLCVRATTLHTEICNYSSYTQYCRSGGYSQNATITYGNLGRYGNELKSGDAFDCDVNGDGVYDGNTERFYYISDSLNSNNSMDSAYATLVFYRNTKSDVSDTFSIAWYEESDNTSYGPVKAITALPTTNNWSNVSLISKRRNILYKSLGNGESVNIRKSNFSYSGYAARLLTYPEIYKGCYNGTTLESSNGTILNCNFLLENTDFSGSGSYSSAGYWLETVYNSSNIFIVNVDSMNVSNVRSSYVYYGVRPVIEIPKSLISY